MSSIRMGDGALANQLAPMVPGDEAFVQAGVTIYGGAVTGLRDKRSAQINFVPQLIDGAVLADTLATTFEESDPPAVFDQNLQFDGTDDGSIKLRDGAASNIRFGIPFTTVLGKTIHSVKLQLSRLGVPAIATSVPNVSVSIQIDAAGSPGGTALGGASRKVLATAISTTRGEITFNFDVGVDLADATIYWIVLEGDYDVSAANCIQLHFNTVAGTSGFKFFDAAWAADTNKDPWFWMEALDFTVIAGLSHPTILGVLPDWTQGEDTLEVDLRLRKDAIRAKYVNTGGGDFHISHKMIIGHAHVSPVS